MELLIDGYNLLHASGVLPSRGGPATLERARDALLMFLGKSLDEEQRQATTIVFDAMNAPPGLPDVHSWQGISVKFARGYASADELLEELIRKHSAPKRLTVVSSDHRVQRAARRRKAQAIDSDQWMETRGRPATESTAGAASDEVKPDSPLSPTEVEHWLKAFGETPDGDS